MVAIAGCEDGVPLLPDPHDGPEFCDDWDNDDDGEFDEPGALDGQLMFADRDGDGFGDPFAPVLLCEELPGYVADPSDCDDGFAEAHPEATEICDGEDSDCDGTAEDEHDDDDGDGFTPCDDDCDDLDPDANPDGTEVCGGGDENCDGRVDEGFGDAYEPNDLREEAAPLVRDDQSVEIVASFLTPADRSDFFRVETENDGEFLVNTFHVSASIAQTRGDLAVGLVLHASNGDLVSDFEPSDGLHVGWYASSFGWGGGGTYYVEVVYVAGASCEAGDYRLVVENSG